MRNLARTFIYWFIGFYLCFFSVGCNTDAPSGNLGSTNETLDSLVSEIVVYSLSQEGGDTATYTQKMLYKAEIDSPNVEMDTLTRIIFSYPEIKASTSVEDSVNNYISEKLRLGNAGDLAYKSAEDRMKDFIAQYEEDRMLGWGGNIKWVCEVNVAVLLNTPRLLTLEFEETNFTGGAHANASTRYLNFSMETGKLLALKDILLPDYEQNLIPQAEHRFWETVRKRGLSPDHFEFSYGEFYLPANFAILKNGLRFRYGTLEISAYSVGPFEFFVPFDDILENINQGVLR